MFSKAPVLFITLCLSVAAGACRSDDVPDARLSQPPPGGADARTADAGGGGTADAAATADAKPPADASATADAKPPADAAATPDSPIMTPDAGNDTPDASTEPDAHETGAAPATVILNELSPNIADNHELVELLVTSPGTVKDIELRQDYSGAGKLLAKLPDVEVGHNDLIVIHLHPVDSVIEETASRAECTDPACYGQAWDFVGEAAGSADFGYSYRVAVLKAANGDVLDAVPFMRHTDFAQKPAAFATDLPQIITDDLWNEVCVDPCDYDHLDNMYAASVDWSDAGNAVDGNSVQRKSGGVNDHKLSDWNDTVVAPTLGDYNK